MCTQSPGLVSCYGGDGNQDGLTFIHGWSQLPGGTPAAAADPRRLGPRRHVRRRPFGAVLPPSRGLRLGRRGRHRLRRRRRSEQEPAGGIAPSSSSSARLRRPGMPHDVRRAGTVGRRERKPLDGRPERDAHRRSGRSTFSITGRRDSPRRHIAHSGTFARRRASVRGRRCSRAPVDYLKLTTEEPGVLDPNSRNSGPGLASVDRHGGLPEAVRDREPTRSAASSFASRAPRAARTRRSTATGQSTSRRRSRTAARRRTA